MTTTPLQETGAHRRWRVLTGGLTATGLAAGLLVGAAPAEAAGGAAPDVRACLRYVNGTAYANKPLQLLVHDGSRWVSAGRNGYSNASGCGTFVDVPANRYYYIQGYWTYAVGSAGYYYLGNSNSVYVGSVYDGLYTAGRLRDVNGPYRLY